MDDFPLPPDLKQLEQELAARPRPQPPGRLRQQVLRSVRVELRREQAGARWGFAVSVAATVLLWLNLSLSATQATDCGLAFDGRAPSAQRAAEEIRLLLPDVSPDEAMRQAILLRAGAGVVPCPKLEVESGVRARNEEWAKSFF